MSKKWTKKQAKKFRKTITERKRLQTPKPVEQKYSEATCPSTPFINDFERGVQEGRREAIHTFHMQNRSALINVVESSAKAISAMAGICEELTHAN